MVSDRLSRPGLLVTIRSADGDKYSVLAILLARPSNNQVPTNFIFVYSTRIAYSHG